MEVKSVFSLNLLSPIPTGKGNSVPGCHGDTGLPKSEMDPDRGLRFPLASGALTYASKGRISDDAGTIEIVFRPAGSAPDGALVQAFGQYPPMIQIDEGLLCLNVYEHRVALNVLWCKDLAYTLRVSWDHTCGVTIFVSAKGTPSLTVRRRFAWQAFRQEYQPLSFGGMSTASRYRKWEGTFDGWIESVRIWNVPLDAPGPISISADGSQVRVPFELPSGVRALEYVQAPLVKDRLPLVQMPDRLNDLRKTREVCGLENILSKCKSEIEMFTRLTSYVGNLWPHCNYWPWPKEEQRHIFWKRGHEMIPEIAAGRMGGMCGGYAHVMEELFWAMGFDARRIQVSGHSSFEAYSNVHDKWIVCDASYNRQCHMFSDGSGNFLGAADIIRRFEQLEHNPDALDDVHPLNCIDENLLPMKKDNAYYSVFKNPANAYVYVGVCIDKTSQYGKTNPVCISGNRYAAYFMRNHRAVVEKKKEDPFGVNTIFADSLDDLYPSRNRVVADFSWKTKGESLNLDLKQTGVTFPNGYRITLDGLGLEWKRNSYVWNLHPGVNRLSVQSVNKLGAVGSPLKITLWRNSESE